MTLLEALIEISANPDKHKEVWAQRKGDGEFASYSPAVIVSDLEGCDRDEYSYACPGALPEEFHLTSQSSGDDQYEVMHAVNEGTLNQVVFMG